MNHPFRFYDAMCIRLRTIATAVMMAWILPALCGFGQDPEVAALLKQLGAKTHAERQAAQRGLQSHLPEARQQIKEFLKTERDPEILERLKTFSLERRVGVVTTASSWKDNHMLFGAMASYAEQEDLQLTLIRGRAWTFGPEGPDLVRTKHDEWIVDLRGQDTPPADVIKKVGTKRVGFITDQPIPGYLTVSAETGDGMAVLVDAIAEDAPKGATLAVFAGLSRSTASAQRLAAFSNLVEKTNLKIVSTPRYADHWTKLGEAGGRLKKAHPDIQVLVDLDPYQHGYFHWRVARQFPETKTYILHGNRGTLQLLMNGSVNAMVTDQSPRLALACLQHLVREGGAAKSIVLKTEPALRAKDALQRAQHLRKLELLGKIAAP